MLARGLSPDPVAMAAAAAFVATAGFLAGRAASGAERDQLREAARRDALTGLYNRAGWRRRARPAVAAALGSGRPAAVGLVAVDWLKTINDTLGHAAGDTALTTLADRLARHVPAPGLAARIGGDEFAFVLVAAADAEPSWLARAGHALHERLRRPVRLAGAARELSVSLGVAPATDAADIDVCLAQADFAMYRAKHTRDHVAVYTPRGRAS
jgi:diguanylate cyclase (GGDEF)-like protein